MSSLIAVWDTAGGTAGAHQRRSRDQESSGGGPGGHPGRSGSQTAAGPVHRRSLQVLLQVREKRRHQRSSFL